MGAVASFLQRRFHSCELVNPGAGPVTELGQDLLCEVPLYGGQDRRKGKLS